MKITWKHILALGIMACGLQGCPLVVGGAAGAATTAVIYDHRAIQSVVKDNEISSQINAAIRSDDDLRNQCHIVVSTFSQNVLLAGQAPSEDLRTRIVNMAKQVPDVKRIYNEITIEAPTSTLTRTSDSWITSKVKTKFLATQGLSSSHFKVVTENGTVFLIGNVTRDQADLAISIARKINGVQKIVKIFNYKNN